MGLNPLSDASLTLTKVGEIGSQQCHSCTALSALLVSCSKLFGIFFQNLSNLRSNRVDVRRSVSLDESGKNVVKATKTMTSSTTILDENDDSDISERITADGDSLEDQGVQDSGVGSSSEKTSTVKNKTGSAEHSRVALIKK